MIVGSATVAHLETLPPATIAEGAAGFVRELLSEL